MSDFESVGDILLRVLDKISEGEFDEVIEEGEEV